MATTSRGGDRSTDPGRRPTKAERKEQARQEREEIQRRMASKKRTRTATILIGAGLVGILAVLLFVVLPSTQGSQPLPGLLTTPGPWTNNTEDLAERLDLLGLPGLSEVVNHIHTPLSVTVDGQAMTVPASIGVDQANGITASLHTHDETGSIHVEAADAAFVGTLGQFFDVWGVRFTSGCLGGNCTDADAVADTDADADPTLRVFVDGEEFAGDPRSIPLEDQRAIVVTFGTEDQLPASVQGGSPSGSG